MSESRYTITSKKYLSDPEFAQLQKTLAKFETEDFRNTTMIWFMMHTGTRAQEALNVEPSDLNHDAGTVFIRALKGSNDRELPLPAWLFERMAKLVSESKTVFTISYKRLYQVWELYRPCKKSPKALRHTFAQRLYADTLDLRFVQYALGHRSIANTMVYADHHYNQSELKKRMPDFGGPKGRKIA